MTSDQPLMSTYAPTPVTFVREGSFGRSPAADVAERCGLGAHVVDGGAVPAEVGVTHGAAVVGQQVERRQPDKEPVGRCASVHAERHA